MVHCNDHSGHEARINQLEEDIEKMKKIINQVVVWVISGMGSALVAVGYYLVSRIMK